MNLRGHRHWRAERPIRRLVSREMITRPGMHIGAYSRGSYLPVDHALRSEPGADVQARRRRECRRGLSWPPEAGFALPAFPSLSAGAQRPRHTHHGMLSGADGSQAPPGSLAGAPELPGLFAIADPRRTGHCGTERSCVRAFTIDRPRSVTAGDPPARLGGKPVPGGQARGGSCGQRRESPWPATGKAGRAPGDGPGGSARSRPREVAGPAGDGAVADLAARDPNWGNGHGEAAGPGLLIRSRDTGPVAVTVPCVARTPRGTDEGSWSAVRGEHCVN